MQARLQEFVRLGREFEEDEEDENMQSLQTDGRTDKQQAIKKAYLSFQLRWTKNQGLLPQIMLGWSFVIWRMAGSRKKVKRRHASSKDLSNLDNLSGQY